MLNDATLHKQILAGFQREPTVDDKYGVHFKYEDLFSRLMAVKIEREGKAKALIRRRSLPKQARYNKYFDLDIKQNEALTERTVHQELNHQKNRKSLASLKYGILQQKQQENVKRSLSPYRQPDNANLDARNRPKNPYEKRIKSRAKSSIEQKEKIERLDNFHRKLIKN
ncbi:unnamed protein product [Blepharisma stoltei]|uniref:Uncharacterized protein n=1 Tax=Blepharisma stoltei TaxID=1481888 RepID=A0AAU9I9C8_9CILI|nr:unnamed protein product [Blepharisma stoltei]